MLAVTNNPSRLHPVVTAGPAIETGAGGEARDTVGEINQTYQRITFHSLFS